MPHTSKATSSSGPAPRQATDPTTVDRLMRAAAQAFAEKGFHATTTRDIASGAGLSPAGVYVHFASILSIGRSKTYASRQGRRRVWLCNHGPRREGSARLER